jgi:hypothetical protein
MKRFSKILAILLFCLYLIIVFLKFDFFWITKISSWSWMDILAVIFAVIVCCVMSFGGIVEINPEDEEY